MRKTIQDLAYAKFQYEKPQPRFSTERLEFEVLQKETYRGSFSFSSNNGMPMRGMVYSSNQRMQCLTPEFDGKDITVEFEYRSDGLKEGDTQKGEFIIVCNGGEYSLSFVVSVIKFYPMTSIGQIKNLFDFANLAQASYEEAFRIFTTPFFENILKKSQEKERLLYRTLGADKATLLGMEEFLIGIRKKKKVTFTVEDGPKQLVCGTQTVQEKIRIHKKEWGYLDISVNADCETLEPVKNRITTADFIGNYVDVEFIVHPDKLHGGRNYGRIIFKSIHQTECCEICVCTDEQREETAEAKKSGREQKRLLQQLTRLYMDFRMGSIVIGMWVKESLVCLKTLRELDSENQWYTLYQAQLLISNKQCQEAEWILKAFHREAKEKSTPVYVYYMYLCTLQEKDSSRTSKLFWRIKEIYKRNREDDRLFLIMLFLDPELQQNESRKLSVIEKRLENGNRSPVLYMEAYELIRKNIYLLQKTEDTELRILYWAAKENMLNPEVVAQICKCMAQVRQFHPLWYKILEACYLVMPEREVLKTLCSFCIKWNLNSEEMFVWYEKAVQEELRLAGLFEAWLNCAGKEQIEQFPKTVLLYFQYQNNLNYKKQALLYACIVRNKENPKALFQTYEETIKQFVIEQLRLGKIDKNLAVLYEAFLPGVPWDKELAEVCGDLLYTHRIVCEDENAKKVVVVHTELEQEQIVPLVHGRAYVQLYSDSYCIMMEDARGVRYRPVQEWTMEKLLRTDRYAKKAIELAPDKLSLLIHHFNGRKTYHSYQKEDLPRLKVLMNASEISDIYKSEIRPQMIEYYYNFYMGAELDEYLSEVDYRGLKRDDRNKLLSLMIARGIYDRVYEMLDRYGMEQASISKLVMVATQKILSGNYQQEPLLDGLCYTIFDKGKCNEIIVKYLCRYYQGSLQELEQLWKYAREYEIDTAEVEERFLIRLLYTQGYTHKMEEIFKSYVESQGQKMLIMAYLSHFSHQYLRKDIVISESFFQCLQQQILLEDALHKKGRQADAMVMNDCCRLAYLKWLTSLEELSEEQEQLQETFLQEYLKRRMYFNFYQKLPNRLLRKYHLYGKIFQEYRTNPQKRVIINYCYTQPQKEIQYQAEYMGHMYGGIFVKTFTAFYGEYIPYYIKEENAQGMEIVQSGYLQTNELTEQEDDGSYSIINDMMLSYHLKDEKTLRQLYAQYEELTKQTEHKFRLL